MQDEDVEATRNLLENMSGEFNQLCHTIRQLPQAVQAKYFNPETLGHISQFFQLGNGFEPAYKNAMTHNMEDLIEDMEGQVKPEDDEDFDEDEES